MDCGLALPDLHVQVHKTRTAWPLRGSSLTIKLSSLSTLLCAPVVCSVLLCCALLYGWSTVYFLRHLYHPQSFQAVPLWTPWLCAFWSVGSGLLGFDREARVPGSHPDYHTHPPARVSSGGPTPMPAST
jgi:hypothetical protein